MSARMYAPQALNQTRWWEHSACRGSDWSLFAPPAEAGRPSPADEARYDVARVICDRCPVRDACRADADSIPDVAFRAGYTASQRRRQNRAVS